MTGDDVPRVPPIGTEFAFVRRHKPYPSVGRRSNEMAGVPKILDIRDDLRRAQDAAEGDISDDVQHVYGLLDTYAAEDRSNEGTLDEIDEELLRLQEQESDDAAEYFQSARNRIKIYRNSLSGEGEDFTVINTRREADGLQVTVVNNTDEPVRGRVVITFLDDEGAELDTATSAVSEFDAHDQQTVTVDAAPDSGDRYVASVERET